MNAEDIRTLTDSELSLVAFAYLGARAPHFVDFVNMRVAIEADSEPQPVADYPTKLTMLLSVANYTAQH